MAPERQLTTVSIEFEGLRAAVEVESERAWEILRFAANCGKTTFTEPIHRAFRKGQRNTPESDQATPGVAARSDAPLRSRNGRRSKAADVRQIAASVLADGEIHPRKEIAAAVREAGLDPSHINHALGKTGAFVKHEHEDAPAYSLDPWSLEEAAANGGVFTDANLLQKQIRYELGENGALKQVSEVGYEGAQRAVPGRDD